MLGQTAPADRQGNGPRQGLPRINPLRDRRGRPCQICRRPPRRAPPRLHRLDEAPARPRLPQAQAQTIPYGRTYGPRSWLSLLERAPEIGFIGKNREGLGYVRDRPKTLGLLPRAADWKGRSRS